MHVTRAILLSILLLPLLLRAEPWPSHPVDATAEGTTQLAVGDLNGDNHPDILAGADDINQEWISWWRNVDGLGLTWTEVPVAANFSDLRALQVADLDGDGDQDILAAGRFEGIAWWENVDGTGLTLTRHDVASHADFPGASDAHAADLDGDGDLDVVGCSDVIHQVRWWENGDGGGLAWSSLLIDSTFTFGTDVHVADLNGDGLADVAGGGTYTLDLVWWERMDDGTWLRHTVESDLGSGRDVSVVDMDGDGNLDLLAVDGYSPGGLRWWDNVLGNGLSWSVSIIDMENVDALSVRAADLDRDGDMDLAVATADDLFSWWEQQHPGPSGWVRHHLGAATAFASAVEATDLDGDGDNDVLGASMLGGLVWWEQPGDDLVPVAVTLAPVGEPVIPPQGGVLQFTVTFTSRINEAVQVRFRTEVQLPNGQWYPEPLLATSVSVPANGVVTESYAQPIPGLAPPGEYELWGWIGALQHSPDRVGASLPFTKTGTRRGEHHHTGE